MQLDLQGVGKNKIDDIILKLLPENMFAMMNKFDFCINYL